MDKKTFALKAIKPYYKDPTKCGFNVTACMNLTPDGKKCVAGKFMKKSFLLTHTSGGIGEILRSFSQKDVFVKSAVDILSNYEWSKLQLVHDAIAQQYATHHLIDRVRNLGLFTYEELSA